MTDIKNMVLDEGLKFEETKHVYTLNGLVIPSVTTIMRPLSDAYYGGVDKKAMEVAADRGTAVHNAIEVYNEYEMDDIPEAFSAYLDAYKQWQEDSKAVILRSETRTYNKALLYAGTADLLCTIGDKLYLVDYKTSYKVVEMLYGVQLEAYAQALHTHGLDVDGKMVLHLKKDGTYAVHEFPARDSNRWAAFMNCMGVYQYLQKERK